MPAPDLQDLVERYHADPSPLGREAATLAGVPLVRSIVGKVPVPDHPLASRDDLEGAGLVGLLEALDVYDPSAGASFMTFAYLRVRGAVIDYLRSLDVLSLDKRRRVAEAGRVAEELRQAQGSEPSDREVADRLGMDLAGFDQLMVEAQARYALSFDAPVGEEGGETFHDILPDDNAEAGYAAADQAHTLGRVKTVIEGLPSRTRAMIGMYYDEELTLRQIGTVFEVSEARVSQILGRAMLTIRTQLSAVEATA